MERYRTTIIMLVLLVALAVAALALNNKTSDPNATPTTTALQYVWQETGPVVGMDIMSGTAKVVLRKPAEATSWSLEQPVKTQADTFAVTSIADSLKSLQATSTLTESKNLADFGLDKTTFQITTTFSDTKGPARTLQIGNPTFDGAGYYVKTASAPTVYVVSNSVIEPAKSWLTTPPVSPPTATPVSLTIVPTPTEAPPVTTVPTAAAGASTTVPVVPSGTVSPSSTISGTLPITNTVPGAANPTTPLASPSASP